MSRRQLLPAFCPALADAADRALADPYRSRRRLAAAACGSGEAGEVVVAGWVYDPELTRTLLVRHPRFGWLSPGGRLWAGEEPLAGALREVTEETGLTVTPVPATGTTATGTGTGTGTTSVTATTGTTGITVAGTVSGRVRAGTVVPGPVSGIVAAVVLGPATPGATERAYGLAYAFTADPAAPVRAEQGQPARWFALDAVPRCAAFPLDHLALRRHAELLRATWTTA
ncbi:8-oxo-dGTP pyrophosphatase MutT (NUDIX family) [Streptacidiphilus sp. MAP12-33]|uniref:NUDIX domain-containing protein n=1 Tax=Streptacidiphilus sp. MAP12-33 TaxID=3156266 RepID=UPI00351547E0